MEEVHCSSDVRPSSNVHLLLLVASLAFTFFVFPSFLNLPSQIFPPHAVKKSWDFLARVLVLFAVTCGFLSRSNHVGEGGSSGLCPDLRAQDEGRWRLYDHTHLDAGRGFGLQPVHSWRIWKGDCDEEEMKFQSDHVAVDDSCDRNAVVKETEDLVTRPPTALPGAPAAPRERKAKKTSRQVPQQLPPLLHTPPPPLEEDRGKERGGPATEESSSSPKMKKKNQRKESINQPLPSSFHQPPPSQPPVPCTLLTSKKGKTMADLYAPPSAAPHKKKSPTPLIMTPNYESSDDSLNSGGLLPLLLLPPPWPTLQVPPWTLAMRGHHAWIKSKDAWRHKSPDAEDYEHSTTESASYSSSSEVTSPAFHPSPDVNKRAGKSIAAVKAGWNQEKTNSRKQRRSNLGPK
ncbi:LOW QUALITY PROTEIN: hypothetical protein BT93_L1972 [Corymbia citriodora subsp. variegata]|uniref:Uncharacterized protein n=1 Tax=Corymbia citriodora subsp. variegata TaxID=360336 RepID=A0A8T0CL50_CORYI|nr:LOW QUALITY PROTEIN: hypothetical protein BT93_L1972 [Corymbia citriodora subsp. variegata]